MTRTKITKRPKCKVVGCEHKAKKGNYGYCGAHRNDTVRFFKTKVGQWLLNQCKAAESLAGLQGLDAQALIELDTVLWLRSMLAGYKYQDGEFKQIRRIHVCHLAARKYTDKNGCTWFGSHHPANLLVGFAAPNQAAGNRPYTDAHDKMLHPWRTQGERAKSINKYEITNILGKAAIEEFIASNPKRVAPKATEERVAKAMAEAGVLEIGLMAELERIQKWHNRPEIQSHIDALAKHLEEVDGFYGTFESALFEKKKEASALFKAGEISSLKRAKMIDEEAAELTAMGTVHEEEIKWEVIWAHWETLFDKIRFEAIHTLIPFDKEHATKQITV